MRSFTFYKYWEYCQNWISYFMARANHLSTDKIHETFCTDECLSRLTWYTSCCLCTCAYGWQHTHTHSLTHTRSSHLSVVLARADSNASNQLVEALWLCVAPPGSIICNAYATLISAPPPPCLTLLPRLRFVLNVVLLKTNLLPIIKIRAKQTAKRKAKNSRKKRKNSQIKNKVKFHKIFCGNRWKSSVTERAKSAYMYACVCVCVVFLLHNLSQIALKRRWHKVCQLCVTISTNCPRYVCHLATRLLIPDSEAC